MAKQFFIIFGCLALGEVIVWATGIKLPSSIIGMLLRASFLKMGIVKLEWVEKLSWPTWGSSSFRRAWP